MDNTDEIPESELCEEMFLFEISNKSLLRYKKRHKHIKCDRCKKSKRRTDLDRLRRKSLNFKNSKNDTSYLIATDPERDQTSTEGTILSALNSNYFNILNNDSYPIFSELIKNIRCGDSSGCMDVSINSSEYNYIKTMRCPKSFKAFEQYWNSSVKEFFLYLLRNAYNILMIGYEYEQTEVYTKVFHEYEECKLLIMSIPAYKNPFRAYQALINRTYLDIWARFFELSCEMTEINYNVNFYIMLCCISDFVTQGVDNKKRPSQIFSFPLYKNLSILKLDCDKQILRELSIIFEEDDIMFAHYEILLCENKFIAWISDASSSSCINYVDIPKIDKLSKCNFIKNRVSLNLFTLYLCGSAFIIGGNKSYDLEKYKLGDPKTQLLPSYGGMIDDCESLDDRFIYLSMYNAYNSFEVVMKLDILNIDSGWEKIVISINDAGCPSCLCNIFPNELCLLYKWNVFSEQKFSGFRPYDKGKIQAIYASKFFSNCADYLFYAQPHPKNTYSRIRNTLGGFNFIKFKGFIATHSYLQYAAIYAKKKAWLFEEGKKRIFVSIWKTNFTPYSPYYQ